MSWNEGKKEDISFFDNRPSLFLIGTFASVWTSDFVTLSIMIQYNYLVKPVGIFRACLHGGGEPQVGEVTRQGGVTRLSI